MLQARNVDPVCGAPFVLLFIGYDGQYYLCCSDWKKEVAFGSVFETSFMAIMGDKLERTATQAADLQELQPRSGEPIDRSAARPLIGSTSPTTAPSIGCSRS